ncbi:hypothetical protein EHS13_10440 [Paenibacillus psychroresistens]|uniref:Alpha-galactosidase n=1 Tax=Paenibacillus psychroresistens TaxID=1778678 RepID=A0A6B8RIX8_9BACL|nr:hypothetical protein [Paenibacillus psychroresistens]QGQ95278.1 hypothetical protein EHS13_10440 [Paenibacillus psychroresistens]
MYEIISNTPYSVLIETNEGWVTASNNHNGLWSTTGIEVSMQSVNEQLSIFVQADEIPLKTLKFRWLNKIEGPISILGDHWERAYGDLEWRGIVAERVMPWYFLTHDGEMTQGYGVKTGAKAFCYWQLDADGITFTADIQCGNEGVLLKGRQLAVADVITYTSNQGVSPFQAAKQFCTQMCDSPVLPKQPVYGGNNWYYAYGNSSHQEILEDSRFISSLASSTTNRPYMVIDDGWQLSSGGGACNGGPWEGNSLFPEMEKLAEEMKAIGVKPGIWCRPLMTSEEVPEEWVRYKVANGGNILDPSVPGALDYIAESVERMVAWGFDLVKHDFTTYDLLGQWGFEMKSHPNILPHKFHDQSKTTAEIMLDLYRVLAKAAGSSLTIGCNTVSHLAAGLFEIQRTGDDTSGKSWERTRYMGVNTLAFRMAQHDTFYSHDADCIGITAQIPWELNRQWLELLAGSGTPLFVSASSSVVTTEQTDALRKAFDLAANPLPAGEPLDWLTNTCPSRWLLNGNEVRFQWNLESAELLNGMDNAWWR